MNAIRPAKYLRPHVGARGTGRRKFMQVEPKIEGPGSIGYRALETLSF
jgi:hypothetical protein